MKKIHINTIQESLLKKDMLMNDALMKLSNLHNKNNRKITHIGFWQDTEHLTPKNIQKKQCHSYYLDP